ncbi:hypothetical protein P170DRAFT_419177 [Aspergillus steynii IBT 23096]|uniref:NACHT domain-containing protein n=1 Tax=Aspergillus steynii IBT 23096 TaxID=1392250 RepID=A0A2I2FRP6_9EURO|nr:uncharacterized protein P170DRAFT_419177 [Aspergillus steynii IBT 23096]PLB43287.1 hypothetical protein P170DRAFT_419177 [Aspergillus steynii IBT 23096]
MNTRRPLHCGDYSVGWICALQCELDAARRALDEIHDPSIELAESDKNTYSYGEIHGHNVVITCLPSGGYGTTPAAVAAQHMNASFPSLRYRFMVGIGGGIPSETNDIRLGDIVVSKPEGKNPGVIQYDMGKTLPSGRFEEVGILNKPPRVLLNAIPHLQTKQDFDQRLAAAIATIVANGETILHIPESQLDRLFHPTYAHPESNSTCDECDRGWLVDREKRYSECPRVHYGLIASGNQVMKDAITRDKLTKDRNVLCYEMEAAGLMDDFECLVIRGICDYSDSHKNKIWQPYAAASAAAYVKALLEVLPRRQAQENSEQKVQIPHELRNYLNRLYVTDPSENRRSLMARRGGPTESTCQWIFETKELAKWLDPRAEGSRPEDSIFWLHGLPGSGKSTMAMCLTEGLERRFVNLEQESFAYFFCEANHDTQNTATTILRGILWQLVRQNPILGDSLVQKFHERQDTLLRSFDALWTVFTEIIVDPRCGVSYCVIDALDECDNESQILILQQLKLSFLDQPWHEFTQNVRILITSRPYQEISEYLRLFPSQDLAKFEERARDIEVFIEKRVDELHKHKSYPDGMASQIRNILQEKSEGTFLWVGLTCEDLMKVGVQDTLPFLERLAPGLDRLYKSLMEKAFESEVKRDTVYSILTVVAVSRKPLTLFQLCMACSLHAGEEKDRRIAFTREDIKLCRLMIVEHDGIVNLLHKSVHDFIFKSDLTQLPTAEESHARLAYSCINYTAQHFGKPLGRLENLLNDLELQQWEAERDGELIEYIREEDSRWDEFIPYCIQYWMEHAHFAGPKFDVDHVTETHFLTLKSLSRERWLRCYRLIYRRVPKNLGLLHIAAKWGIPAFIPFVLGEQSTDDGNYYIDTEFLTDTHSTPLEEAAESGNTGIFTELVSRSHPATVITGSVLTAVFRHNANRGDLISGLLKNMGHRIVVTEDMEIAAAESDGEAPEILKHLLAHRDRRSHATGPHISESVLVAAAKNEDKGEQTMKFMLDYLNHEVAVTEELLKVAASNTKDGTILMEMLLEHWKENDIPESVIAAAAENETEGPFVIKVLRTRVAHSMQITDFILSCAFRNIESGIDCLEQLWKDSSQPPVLGRFAIPRRYDERAKDEPALLWALSKPRDSVVVSEDGARAIFGARSVAAIKKVLALREDVMDLPEDLLVAAASNRHHGLAIFTFLFLSYSQRLLVTERMVAEAVWSNRETLDILLAHKPMGQDVVNREAIRNAAHLETGALDVMNTLLNAKTGSIMIDYDLLWRVEYPATHTEATMNLFLQQKSTTAFIDIDLIKALNYKDWKLNFMERILAMPEDRVTISCWAIDSIARRYGRKNTELLLLHRGVDAIEYGTAKFILQSYDVDLIILMLDRWEFEMTRELQHGASLNADAPGTLSTLLERTSGELPFDEKVLEIVVSKCEPHVIEQYFQRLSLQTESREMLDILAFCQSRSGYTQSLIQLLLQRREDASVKKKLFEGIVESCTESEVVTALRQNEFANTLGPSGMSTDSMARAALRNIKSGSAVFKLLIDDDDALKLNIDAELIYGMLRVLDSKTIQLIAQNKPNKLPGLNMILVLSAAAENCSCGDKVIESILNINSDIPKNKLFKQRSPSLYLKSHQGPWPVTEATMESAAGNQRLGQKIMRLLLEVHPDKVWITDSGLRGIIKNFGIGIIREVMSDDRLQVDIDHGMIEAGVSNRLDGPDVLELLLSQVTTQVEITGKTISIALENTSHYKVLLHQLIASDKIHFGQAAIMEALKTPDSTIITELIPSRAEQIAMNEVCLSEAIVSQRHSPAHIFTIFKYLSKLNQPVTITPKIIRNIRDCSHGLQVIHEVLNYRNDKLRVTAPAMASFLDLYSKFLDSDSPDFPEQLNQWCDCVAVYFRHSREQRSVDDDILVAILRANPDTRYLRRVGAQFSIPAVENFIFPLICGARGDSGEDSLGHFALHRILKNVHSPAGLTAGGLISIIKPMYPMIALEITRLPHEGFRMCQEVAIQLTEVADEKVMAMIFDRDYGCIQVTEDMLLAAAGGSSQVLIYLLGLAPTSISPEIIIRALENDGISASIIQPLVRHLPSQIDINKDLFVAAADKSSISLETIQAFSTPLSFQNDTSEAVLISILKKNSCDERLMEKLLQGSFPLPVIEEAIVVASHSAHRTPKFSGTIY